MKWILLNEKIMKILVKKICGITKMFRLRTSDNWKRCVKLELEDY